MQSNRPREPEGRGRQDDDNGELGYRTGAGGEEGVVGGRGRPGEFDGFPWLARAGQAGGDAGNCDGQGYFGGTDPAGGGDTAP